MLKLIVNCEIYSVGLVTKIEPGSNWDLFCARRLRNGSIEFVNEAEIVSLDGICGGYGICHHGQLEIQYCPGNVFFSANWKYKGWDRDQKRCEVESQISRCSQNTFEWNTNKNLQLRDCIGYDRLPNSSCRIQFISKLRAQVYCEQNENCVGVQEQPCTYHGPGKNVACQGTRWIPFSKMIEMVGQSKVPAYFVNRNLDPNLAPEEQELQLQNSLDYQWDEPMQGSWERCADNVTDHDNNCLYSFPTALEAKKYCENLDLIDDITCDGIAIQPDGTFAAVSDIIYTTRSGASDIFIKLRRIWKIVRSKYTEQGKLTEIWSTPVEGYLSDCATKLDAPSQNCEYFDSLFESQYYCESLANECGGVTYDGNKYSVRFGTSPSADGSSQSWIKARVHELLLLL